MIIHNPILTGSFTYNGADMSSLLSSSANITSLNAATASLNTFSASVLTFTSSANTRLGTLESYTASQDIRNTTYATTGSNTLVGTQYISNTNDAIGFSNTTSSIYTDGGLQVTKNAYFSSSMFIKGNLTVFGTQSVSFITSSQLNISTNVITVNTNTPSVRFGGLSVYDSGSTGTTGSIFWDSQNNHWVYTNPSGSSYSGGMFISGPRASSLGEEQGTTLNAIMKGQGGDHITSSGMFESSSMVGIGTPTPSAKLEVNGYGVANSIMTYVAAKFYGGGTGGVNIGTDGTVAMIATDSSDADMQFLTRVAGVFSPRITIKSGGSIGIGTTNPTTKLTIESSTYDDFIKFTRTSVGSMGISATSPRGIQTTDGAGNFIGWHVNASGSVGIGTTNPSYALHTSAYDGAFALTGTRGTGTTHLWYTSGVNNQNLIYNNPNGDHYFYSNGSPVLSLTTNKYVGIGLNGPTNLLHVNSGTTATQTIANFAAANYGSSSSRTYIQIGTQYEDGSSRIGSINTTGNQSALVFQTHAATSDVWNDAMYINGSGNIGIGTTNPTEILQVNGSIRVLQTSNTGIAQFAADASNTTSLRCGLATFGNAASDVLLGIGRASNSFLYKNGGTLVVGTEGAYPLILSAGDAERMRITNTGLVGIGVTNPQAFVDTSGFGNLVVGNGSGERGITIYSGTTGRGGLMFADATTGSGGYIGYILYNHSTDTMEIATSSVPRLSIKSDGRTWIGGAISGFDGSSAILQINSFTRTSGQMIFHNPSNVAQAVSVACNGADSFNVAGAFSANSKSFLIPHPLASLESTHNLRYVSVESPQADLIYRGKLTLVNGRGQANIDEAATMTEGTFEALCREVQCFTTNETGWDLVKGKVIGNIIYIESQNTESTDEISWLVIGERKDKHMMDTSWTDENGKVIVESLAPEETTII
jgi:hypothetical protein